MITIKWKQEGNCPKQTKGCITFFPLPAFDPLQSPLPENKSNILHCSSFCMKMSFMKLKNHIDSEIL